MLALVLIVICVAGLLVCFGFGLDLVVLVFMDFGVSCYLCEFGYCIFAVALGGLCFELLVCFAVCRGLCGVVMLRF